MQKKNNLSIWLMWALASFFYAYQYILRVLPNIMMTDILERFHIDANVFGQYSGLYYIGYAAMHIPLGILLDKYGPKWVLPACILLTVIGLLPLLYAEHYIYPNIGRLLIGMGSSAAILGVFKILRMSFPESKFTLLLGFSVTIGLIGAIYGGLPVNYFMHAVGVDMVIHVIILVGLLLAVASFLIIPNIPKAEQEQSWMAHVKEVLSNPLIIMICILAGFMVGPLEGFADVWGKQYLISVYKLNDNVAASLPSLLFFGMCIGAPLLSWMATKSNAYFGFIIASALVMGGAFVLLLTGQLPTITLAPLFLLVGFFCAYQIIAIYKASTFVREDLVGLTTACANMIIMSFGYVFHSAIGKILTLQWDGQMVNNVPYYEPAFYTKALMVIPTGLFLAAIGYLIIAASTKNSTAANGSSANNLA